MSSSFHIGEPWQSHLDAAIHQRNQATTSADLARANGAIRRIRLAAAKAKGTHTADEWAGLVGAFDYRCVRCGASVTDATVQKDHILPIYQGGSDGIDNLQPLCRSCNTSKGADATDWVAYRNRHGFSEQAERRAA